MDYLKAMDRVVFGGNFLSKRIWKDIGDIRYAITNNVIVPDGRALVVDILNGTLVVYVYNLNNGKVIGNVCIKLPDAGISAKLIEDVADEVNVGLVRLELKNG